MNKKVGLITDDFIIGFSNFFIVFRNQYSFGDLVT